MSYVIVDKNLWPSAKVELEQEGYTVVETVDIDTIDTSLSTHPDIQLCKIGDTLVVDPRTYDYYKDKMPDVEIIKGSTTVKEKYPDYISYNIAVGEVAIHNLDHTDLVLLDLIKDYKKVHVNQGYSKCNILMGDNFLITSDRGISKAIRGMDHLLIEPGHIDLKDYNYGFIGGASGHDSDRVYFIGDVVEHPSWQQIRDYLKDKNIEIKVLNGGPLTDFGSLIFG